MPKFRQLCKGQSNGYYANLEHGTYLTVNLGAEPTNSVLNYYRHPLAPHQNPDSLHHTAGYHANHYWTALTASRPASTYGHAFDLILEFLNL